MSKNEIYNSKGTLFSSGLSKDKVNPKQKHTFRLLAIIFGAISLILGVFIILGLISINNCRGIGCGIANMGIGYLLWISIMCLAVTFAIFTISMLIHLVKAKKITLRLSYVIFALVVIAYGLIGFSFNNKGSEVTNKTNIIIIKSELENYSKLVRLNQKNPTTGEFDFVNGSYPEAFDELDSTTIPTGQIKYYTNNNTSPKTFCISETVDGTSYYINNTTLAVTEGLCPGH